MNEMTESPCPYCNGSGKVSNFTDPYASFAKLSEAMMAEHGMRKVAEDRRFPGSYVAEYDTDSGSPVRAFVTASGRELRMNSTDARMLSLVIERVESALRQREATPEDR